MLANPVMRTSGAKGDCKVVLGKNWGLVRPKWTRNWLSTAGLKLCVSDAVNWRGPFCAVAPKLGRFDSMKVKPGVADVLRCAPYRPLRVSLPPRNCSSTRSDQAAAFARFGAELVSTPVALWGDPSAAKIAFEVGSVIPAA